MTADPEERIASVRALAEVPAEEPEEESEEGAAVPEMIGRVRKDDEKEGKSES